MLKRLFAFLKSQLQHEYASAERVHSVEKEPDQAPPSVDVDFSLFTNRALDLINAYAAQGYALQPGIQVHAREYYVILVNWTTTWMVRVTQDGASTAFKPADLRETVTYFTKPSEDRRKPLDTPNVVA